jgi:hypothetical protein
MLTIPQKVGWACDIVLKENLNDSDLAAIRLNKENVYKSGSHGDTYLRIARAVALNPSLVMQKASDFKTWVIQECGGESGNEQRLMTIVTSPRYAHFVRSVVETTWGRKGFVIEHFHNLVTQHISEVSIGNQRALIHVILTETSTTFPP